MQSSHESSRPHLSFWTLYSCTGNIPYYTHYVANILFLFEADGDGQLRFFLLLWSLTVDENIWTVGAWQRGKKRKKKEGSTWDVPYLMKLFYESYTISFYSRFSPIGFFVDIIINHRSEIAVIIYPLWIFCGIDKLFDWEFNFCIRWGWN